MPLAERDINIQRDVLRHNKRSSWQTESPHAHTKDENSPLFRSTQSKGTPPSQRVLAPTKASSAKTAPPRTPTQQMTPVQSSKLPRRTATAQETTDVSPKVLMDKPLPVDKPLPARPVASLAALSPSKGRTLIDAGERPLTLVVGGSSHDDWPALTPRSLSAPTTATPVENKSKIFSKGPTRLSDAEKSALAPTVEPTSLMMTKPSIAGSESKCPRGSYITAAAGPKKRVSFESAGTSHDSETLLSPLAGPHEDSRLHIPSPASFSRLRRGSISRRIPSPSPAQRPATTNGARAARAAKTASRIPLPDSKKANLVDVKGRSLQGPTFGSRRLDVPDTLKILDDGIKRREQVRLKQADSSRGCNPKVASTDAYGDDVVRTPSLDRSQSSSPGGTTGLSAADEEEITTPTERPSAYLGQQTAQDLFEDAVSGLGKPPPSTSPYTDPLQSIPSQAILSLHTQECTLLPSRDVTEESDGPVIHKCFSALQTEGSADTEVHHGEDTSITESTRNSLLELLSQYEREDRRLSRAGLPGLDEETRKHITRTLSLLEGKGNPAETDVEDETLLEMFGHLKRGLEKVPKNTCLLENAIAAERYLADFEAGMPAEAEVAITGADEKMPTETRASLSSRNDLTSREKPVHTITSKWSSSTISLKDATHAADKTTSYKACLKPDASNKAAQSSSPASEEPLRSTRYPSRIPGRATTPDSSIGSAFGSALGKTRKQSSPAFSKRRPGSVRAAREALQSSGRIGQSTVSSASKKTAKVPTPNTKSGALGDQARRGRLSSAEKAMSKSEVPAGHETPRARSKSRYVLNKLNGLFSGKRDKKSTVTPPVRVIQESRTPENCNVTVALNGSPVLKPTKVPTLPDTPNMPPSGHPVSNSASHQSDDISTTTPVDRFITGKDSIAIQDWSESLMGHAQRESHPVRKARLLNFAKVLNDALLNAREAQISAETAQHAARSAQLSYEMTQQSIAVLHNLVKGLNGPRRR